MTITNTTLRSLLLTFRRHNVEITAMDLLDWQDDGNTQHDIIHRLLEVAYAASQDNPELYDAVKYKVHEYWKVAA